MTFRIHLVTSGREFDMDMMSRAWAGIQRTLLPFLREELGPLDEPLERLAAILEVVRVEEFVPAPLRGYPGRPPLDRRPIARAFVAKAVLGLAATRILIADVKRSPALRRMCGWERTRDVPDEATFSRAFAEFAEGELGARVHTAMIETFVSPRLVGHLSRDSTAIEAREKAVPRPSTPSEPAGTETVANRRGRPRRGESRPTPEPTRLQRQADGMGLEEMVAELPTDCDWGCKKNSRGKVECWKGYKLHLDWADGMIPVSVLMTSASVHDSQVAIPLATMSATRVTSLYDLMDSAYDAAPIRGHCVKLGHVPLIDANRRRGDPIPFEPAEATRYTQRTNAERGNGRLKDDFGARFVRVRGHTKVFCHLMFGVLALTADQLLRLVTG